MSSEAIDPSTLEDGLYAYKGDSVIACAIVFSILCTTFVALRFISLGVEHRSISLEDWIMIPAWVIMMGFCANVICTVKFGGVGRHEAYVLKFMPEAMISWAQTLFVTELMYGILFPLEKTSILLLYLRFFQIHRWFRFTTYVLIAYIWMWGVSEVLVAIFQCNPVAYQWDRTISGTCIDQLGYYRWVSVPNVVHDVAMLILPAPVVWKLQIGLRQKLALTGVFLIGSIGCIASFIRLSIFFRQNALQDNTWASVQLMSWTLAETGVILICACLPALWPLVLRLVTGVGSLHSKHHSERTNLSDNIELKQRGSVVARNGRDYHAFDEDDIIPLNDASGGVIVARGLRSSPASSSHDTGIRVTKEFSWKTTEARQTADISGSA
ncbi:hypothetical protein GGS26DRAFT_599741 [Hypomontagnella submonticulosa]|nr:hypothetical protein GGS26DRAFT_599741 [Hypomontagnella submonticulosa]